MICNIYKIGYIIYDLFIFYICIRTYIHACVCVCYLPSYVRLFETPWTVAHQVSLSLEFSRQEYWTGLPFPPPGDLPDPGIKPGSPALQADFLLSELPGAGHFSAPLRHEGASRYTLTLYSLVALPKMVGSPKS